MARSEPADLTASPRERFGVPLAPLTTLHLGGPARRIVEASCEEHVTATVAAADAAGEPLLVMAGGSNLVIADEGFPGTVLAVGLRGVSTAASGDRVMLTAAAGEPWDRLVAGAVTDGLAGLECLSGIPGATGATPIQNVGAYGQQVSDTIVAVRAYDRATQRIVELSGVECDFAYRSSRFRGRDSHVVLAVSYALQRSRQATPIRYPELASALDAAPGARPSLSAVREAVLGLRRGKGMVLDPGDPDAVSAGSFFVNPILPPEAYEALARVAVRRLGEGVAPPAWPEPDGRIKTSAAWLIERAGFHRGYGGGAVGISSKHTLALVNRGGATTAQLIALAREVRDGVRAAFEVTLTAEPVLVGVAL